MLPLGCRKTLPRGLAARPRLDCKYKGMRSGSAEAMHYIALQCSKALALATPAGPVMINIPSLAATSSGRMFWQLQ